MENWQFLIQKQGERTWLPLESPNLQILEGRYRVVARSNRKNTGVEVRVSYFSTKENPQKRKIQKRLRRTNAEGLMAAIPFTYLKPGLWELRCSADIMSDLLGKPWQYTLKLNVLPGVQEDKQISRQGDKKVEELLTPVVETEVQTFETSGKAILSQSTSSESIETISLKPQAFSEESEPGGILKSKFTNQNSKTLDIFSERENQNLKQEKVIPVAENLAIENELFLSSSLENEVVENYQVTTDNPLSPSLENTYSNLDIREYKDEILDRKTEIINSQEEIFSNETEIFNSQEEISSNETGIFNSQEEISSNETEIFNSQEEIFSNETEIFNSQEEISSNQTEIINSQEEISSNQTEIINSQEEISSNQTEIINSQEEISSNETEIFNFQEKISSHETGIFNPILEADIIDKEPAAIVLQRNFAITQFLDKQDDGVIDVSISPIWIQGNSAEKILENLIDLALPSPESVLEDEKFDNFITPSESLPLKLVLDEENYFASWGEALIINGRLETQVIDNGVFGDTLENYALCAGEVRIELRSPQESHIIAQIRQTLPEHLLPYNFSCSLNIPKDCQSKLILAEISLYGTLDFATELILLANQSFSITANVNELMAFSAFIYDSTHKLIDELEAEPQWLTPPQPSTPIDLQLFNLVKSVKAESSLNVQKLPKKSLPPTLKTRVNQKYVPHRSPKLPKFSESPIKEETLTNHEDNKYTTLPFLKKYKNLSSSQELAVKDTPILNTSILNTSILKSDNSNISEFKDLEKNNPEQIKEIQILISQEESNPEKITQKEISHGEIQKNIDLQNLPSDNFINEENLESAVEDNNLIDETSLTDFIEEENLQGDEKTKLSPLILKWMQSQGIPLPESVNFQNQSINHQSISKSINQSSLNQNVAVNNLDDTNIILDKEQLLEDRKVSQQKEELVTTTPPIQPDTRRGEFIDNLVRNNNNLSESTSALPIKKLSTKVMEEIVVDDVEDELQMDTNFQPNRFDEQSEVPLSVSFGLNTAIIEVLPTPSLHIPDRELISGQSIIVRVQLATVKQQVAIKLWVEDCQTRWLLDGPHWLSGLLPSPFDGLEVTTHLNVPFGCVEIRIEAIAVDLATKQESHKVSIMRSVVPPNLPVVKMDELLI